MQIERSLSKIERDLRKKTLQRLANAVTDEAHWQKVLEKAGPAEREELERIVAPLLTFRR